MKILVVDDESVQRDLLADFLAGRGHEVWRAGDGAEALRLFAGQPIQLALVDQRMPGMDGVQLIAALKALNPLVSVIMITAYGAVELAVKAMKLGADDFLEKPVDLGLLLEKLDALEQRQAVTEDAQEVAATASSAPLPLDIVGDSEPMREVFSLVRRVAETPWAVLVRGETGTGKELIARLIHQLSPRKEAPFVEVNCAAIPENLFESELFGHEKGSFTGASARRRGRFELAAGGTLFLDEVGELPLNLQPKLLRALQEQRFTRVGGEQEVRVDVRVVAATNKELRQLAEAGRFREDLYYRLNVFEIPVPPLRMRRSDIPGLIAYFLGRHAPRPIEFSGEALDALMKYPYPGNVRELEHIVQRVATLARGRQVRLADLPPEVGHPAQPPRGVLEEELAALEREMLSRALEQADGVQTKAAELLGINERVLRYKLEKHGMKKGPAG